MKILPLDNTLLVKVERAAEKTMSGIILPSQDEEGRLEAAKVVERGSDVGDVSRGDKILFKSYNLDSVKYEGEEYHFLQREHVLAVMEE